MKVAIVVSIILITVFSFQLKSMRGNYNFWQQKKDSLLEQRGALNQKVENLVSQNQQVGELENILGQAILIFLAELGIRVPEEQLNFTRQVIEHDSSKTGAIKDAPNGPKENKRTADVISEVVFTAQEVARAKKVMDQNVVADLYVALREQKFITSAKLLQDAAYAVDSYRGNIYLIKEERLESFTLRTEWDELDKCFNVFYAIGDTSSDGTRTNHFFNLPGDLSNGLFVQIMPDSYLQFYRAKESEILVGNYYQEISTGKYERTGIVRLKKE